MILFEDGAWRVRVAPESDDPVVAFAATELATYLERLGGTPMGDAPGRIRLVVEPPVGGTRDIWDDGIEIRQDGDDLVLAGVCPRSVLFAVYELLERLGVRWLYPGSEGEHVPRCQRLAIAHLPIRHTPSLRVRGVVAGVHTEWHATADDWVSLIEWAARLRSNHVFIELFGASVFTDPQDEQRVAAEIHRRGMVYETGGHGIHVMALDLSGPDPTPGERERVALIDGERRVAWHDVYGPIATQGCFANPAFQQRQVDAMVGFARAHPEADMVAFWIADNWNVTCECEACAKHSPSDWVAAAANRISARMARDAPGTYVEFLAYLDTLFPPDEVRIEPAGDNLRMNFAPSVRCYRHSLGDPTCRLDGRVSTWRDGNRKRIPRNRELVDMFEGWCRMGAVPGASYEYYRWWHERDRYRTALGLYPHPSVLEADVRTHQRIGNGGILQCQFMRSYFPVPQTFYICAQLQWRVEQGGQGVYRDFHEHLFGESAGTVLSYLDAFQAAVADDESTLDSLEPEAYARLVPALCRPETVRDKLAQLARCRQPIDELAVRARADRVGARVRRLAIHHDYCRLRLQAYLLRGLGDKEAMARAHREAAAYVRARADRIGPYVNVYEMDAMSDALIKFS